MAKKIKLIDKTQKVIRITTTPMKSVSPEFVAEELGACMITSKPNQSAKLVIAPPAGSKKLFEIKASMAGGFHLKPKPDENDFVTVGQMIEADTTIGLVEAMKIFFEIKAECSGTIAEICVKNGDCVKFGTVLVRVQAA